MRRALVCSCFGFAGLAIADAAEGDGFSRHSKLEEVRYETLLMEKKLEYAKLELEELRTRHERDMRATAISVAQAMAQEFVAETPSEESIEPRISGPASGSVKRHGGRRRSVRRPKQRGNSGLLAKSLVENATRLPGNVVGSAYNPEQYLRVGQEDRRRVEVVIWNKIRGFLDWLRPDFVSSARERCATECVVSSDRQRLSHADGVIFHAKTHSTTDFPRKKPPGTQYLLVSLEQEKYAPLLRQRNYMSRFDGILTFNLNSTLPMITVHPHWNADHYFEAQMQPWKMKLDAASAFISNCRNAGAQDRLDFLKRLMNQYPVHSYGRCLHNKNEPAAEKGQQRGESKRRTLANYKFYLAFENDGSSKDYVSEKVYDAILAGTLPVYRGTETVKKLLPAPDAVVHVADFDDDPLRVARHLQYLTRNQSAYNSYFRWREKPRDQPAVRASFQTILDMTAYKYTALCRICAYLDARKLR